jgi:yecA family protein
MLNFEKNNEEALLSFLGQLGARDAVLNYRQIHGLLYAMSCSPEPVVAAEWFELIWLSDAPQFDDAATAKDFYRLLVALSRSIDADVQGDRYRFGDASDTNSAAELADWCDGFLIGHHYLEHVWEAALGDLDDEALYEQIDAVLDWAIACASGEIADRDHDRDGDDGDTALLAGHLHFQQLLTVYRDVRQRWQTRVGDWDIHAAFAALEPALPDEPCPCGSGRLFKRCCLH